MTKWMRQRPVYETKIIITLFYSVVEEIARMLSSVEKAYIYIERSEAQGTMRFR